MDFRKTMQESGRSPWSWALLFFLLVAALKWRFAARPPAWDEADSIFSAADWLATHHFNVAGMLHDPGCGAHWFSLMSFVTAAVVAVCGSGQAGWTVLHLMQWGMGAAAAAVFLRMLVPLWGRGTAFFAALLFLLMPVTLGQLGCMYAEIPLTLFSVAAVAMHLRGRTGLALLFCALACFTKESGFIVAAALGCAGLLEAETRLKGIRRAFFYWVPCAAVTLATAASFGGAGTLPLSGRALAGRIDIALHSLAGTFTVIWCYLPDHIVLLAACSLLAVFVLGQAALTPRDRRGAAPAADRLALVAGLFILGFTCLFWGVVAVAWDNPNYLPRYLVQALPFAIVLAVHAARPLCRPRVLAGGLAVLALFAAVNRRGMFYPAIPIEDLFNVTVLAERSEECGDWYFVTRDSLAAAEEVPSDVPLLCARAMHVLARHPALGYVSRPLPNALWILREPAYRQARAADLPARFYLLDDHANNGGPHISRLAGLCGEVAFPLEIRSERVFACGMFNARLLEIVRKQHTAPPPSSEPAHETSPAQ